MGQMVRSAVEWSWSEPMRKAVHTVDRRAEGKEQGKLLVQKLLWRLRALYLEDSDISLMT